MICEISRTDEERVQHGGIPQRGRERSELGPHVSSSYHDDVEIFSWSGRRMTEEEFGSETTRSQFKKIALRSHDWEEGRQERVVSKEGGPRGQRRFRGR